MARPRRFERPTPAFGGQYSIQLSYGRVGRGVYHVRFIGAALTRYNSLFSQYFQGIFMSASSHSNESEGLIKTPTQLIVVVVLAFVVPIVAIFTIIHFVMGDKPRPASSTTYDKAILDRIRPIGNVPAAAIEKGPSPLVPAPVTAATAPSEGKAAAAGPDGKAIYEATCKACHDTGLANAPKKGDKAAWGSRGAVAALVASAVKGKGGMPAKGGNPSLTEGDLKAAVEYMTR